MGARADPPDGTQIMQLHRPLREGTGPGSSATIPATFAEWLRSGIQPGGSVAFPLYQSTIDEPVELLRDAVEVTLAAGRDRYYRSTFNRGNPVVVSLLAQDYGVGEDQVLCTTGATAGISLIYRALLDPDSRLLIENPCFDLFETLASPIGCGIDRFERHAPDYALDCDALMAQVRPDTKLVVLSNLHNPSGMPAAEGELRRLGALAQQHGFHVLVDEVYAPFAGASITAAASLGLDRLISVSSLSKGFGLATLRCGWIVGDAAALQPIRKLNSELEFSVSNLAHGAAARVLDQPEPFQTWSASRIAAARPIVERHHREWTDAGLISGCLPPYGCIALCTLPGIPDSYDFSVWLEQQYGVRIVPGLYFGAPDSFRLGFGIAPDLLEEGLTRLGKGLFEYRQLWGNTGG